MNELVKTRENAGTTEYLEDQGILDPLCLVDSVFSLPVPAALVMPAAGVYTGLTLGGNDQCGWGTTGDTDPGDGTWQVFTNCWGEVHVSASFAMTAPGGWAPAYVSLAVFKDGAFFRELDLERVLATGDKIRLNGSCFVPVSVPEGSDSISVQVSQSGVAPQTVTVWDAYAGFHFAGNQSRCNPPPGP